MVISCRGNGIFLLLLYFGLNVGYSNGLKNVPIADITILVSGFLIRVFYGASITGIQVSGWLYLTIIAVSFYFGLGKRRNEIMATGTGETRKEYYSITQKISWIKICICALPWGLYSMHCGR